MDAAPPPTRDSLIAAYQAVAARTRGHVSRKVFQRETGIVDRAYLNLFGTYNALVVAAGGRPYTANVRISDERLLRDLRNAWLRHGGPVARAEISALGPHHLRVYLRRWGNWASTLAAFRDWLRRNDPKFPYLTEMRREGAEARERQRARDRGCGELLNFRSFLHAPTSESGVVLLFGMVAGDLGFLIEAVSPAFPDCEAKRREGSVWKRVRIEFELKSRNFAAHGHDEEGCDLIVCWEHDWPGCVLPVLELKSEIEKLRGAA